MTESAISLASFSMNSLLFVKSPTRSCKLPFNQKVNLPFMKTKSVPCQKYPLSPTTIGLALGSSLTNWIKCARVSDADCDCVMAHLKRHGTACRPELCPLMKTSAVKHFSDLQK